MEDITSAMLTKSWIVKVCPNKTMENSSEATASRPAISPPITGPTMLTPIRNEENEKTVPMNIIPSNAKIEMKSVGIE